MKYEETKIRRMEDGIRLLEVGCRGDRSVYCVTGSGRTKHYEDYEDALEEFNLRWMKSVFGDK